MKLQPWSVQRENDHNEPQNSKLVTGQPLEKMTIMNVSDRALVCVTVGCGFDWPESASKPINFFIYNLVLLVFQTLEFNIPPDETMPGEAELQMQLSTEGIQIDARDVQVVNPVYQV